MTSGRGTRNRVPGARGTGTVAGLIARHGWRVFAVPVLAVVTVVALLQHGGSHPRTTEGLTQASRATGRSASGFSAGATPAPIVVSLQTDTATSCAHNTYPQLILVSIREQRMWACERAREVDHSPVTTGSVVHHDQTPLGSWRVQAKQRDRYLVGPGYRDYVQYWVPFNGDFGLHDASWQTMPFGSAQWPTRGSHGCVHFPTDVMAWIYHWVTVGSTVVTIER